MTHIVYERADGTAAATQVAPGATLTPDQIAANLAHDGQSYKLIDQAPDLGGLPNALFDYDGRYADGLRLNQERLAGYLSGKTAAERYRREVEGVTVNGVPFATDRQSQSKLASERERAKSGTRTDGARWKCADGVFRSFTNAEIIAAADAIGSYVASLFEAEADVAADIAAGTITTAAGVTGAAWPSSTLTTA